MVVLRQTCASDGAKFGGVYRSLRKAGIEVNWSSLGKWSSGMLEFFVAYPGSVYVLSLFLIDGLDYTLYLAIF